MLNKKLISILLLFVMFMGFIPKIGEAASISNSQFMKLISEFRNTFRHGEYWNYYSSHDYSESGKNPCICNQKYCAYGGVACICKCGAFIYDGKEIAWQCRGYACMLGNKIFGGNPNTFTSGRDGKWSVHKNYDSVYAGDLIRYGSGWGHTVFVYKVEGSKIFYTDCNYSGPCRIRWTDTAGNALYFKKSDLKEMYNTQISHFDGNDCTGGNFVIEKPSSPSSVSVSKSDLAIDESISASWDTVSGATGYDVRLVCSTDSTYNQSVSVTGTGVSFILKNAGSYKIAVSAKNSAGNSSEKSSSTFTVHSNITVTFKDYDGTLLSIQKLKYGGSAKAPYAPSRKGYTFQGWDKSLTDLKTDITVTALYEINVYTVKFIDGDSETISTQRVSYGESAVAPESITTPNGYIFVGWDNDNYGYVTSDLTVNAVFAWENDDLPVIATIESAVRNTDASGYNLSVNIKNNPDNFTRGRIIAALKTEAGKMVASEISSFSLTAGESSNESIFISYSGVATTADVSIVGIIDDDNTGVPLAESVSQEIDLGLEWSDWSVNAPPEGDYITESRTEYRYMDKSTTSSTSASLSGWTRYGSELTGWGSWSSWQNSYVSSSSSRQVETKTIPATYETRYTYERSVNNAGTLSTYSIGYYPNYQSIDLNYKLSALGTQNGHTHYGPYAGNYGTYLQKYWWNESSYQKKLTSAYTQYRYRDAIYTYYYYKWGGWSAWSPTAVSSTSSRQVETRTTYRFKSNDIKITAYNYKRYKYQNLNDGNRYYTYTSSYADSMGYLGEWEYNKSYSELTKITTVDNNISLYNGYGKDSWYSADVNTIGNVTEYITYDTLEDTSGNTYTISGQVNAPNKNATIMVYKGTNVDPTANQLQYVEQITLDDDGKYSISFNPKEVPSLNTGDFVVMMGVEGGTAPIYLDTIYAPKSTYGVEFVDEDGNLLNEQIVIEGENALAPETVPVKDGYDFVGWDTGITNIHSDLTITAQYKKKEYTVIFVDWENNDIEIKSFSHGDLLETPEPVQQPGSTFEGWDAVIDGITTVTENMVVSAVYTVNQYTISFADWNGDIMATETVEYGHEVPLPEAPQMENMVFMGWSDLHVLLFAHEDATVSPIYGYEETVEAPVANLNSGTYQGTQIISLANNTAESKIFYCVSDESDAVSIHQGVLSPDSLEYKEYVSPVEITDSSSLIFYAEAENMNKSDYVIRSYDIAGSFDVQITGSTLKNEDDVVSGKIYYNVVLTGNSTDAVTVIAIYNNIGRLVYMDIGEPVLWTEGDNIGSISDILFPFNTGENYTVKLFLWKNVEALKPFSDVATIKYN